MRSVAVRRVRLLAARHEHRRPQRAMLQRGLHDESTGDCSRRVMAMVGSVSLPLAIASLGQRPPWCAR